LHSGVIALLWWAIITVFGQGAFTGGRPWRGQPDPGLQAKLAIRGRACRFLGGDGPPWRFTETVGEPTRPKRCGRAVSRPFNAVIPCRLMVISDTSSRCPPPPPPPPPEKWADGGTCGQHLPVTAFPLRGDATRSFNPFAPATASRAQGTLLVMGSGAWAPAAWRPSSFPAEAEAV